MSVHSDADLSPTIRIRHIARFNCAAITMYTSRVKKHNTGNSDGRVKPPRLKNSRAFGKLVHNCAE